MDSNTFEILVKLSLFIFGLGASAFLSSSETALFSLKAKHLFRIRYKNPKIYETITFLLSNSEDFITMLLALNELINVFVSVLFANIFQSIFGNKYLAFSSGLVVFLLLLFGEITPKSFAAKNNISISIAFARPLYFLYKISYPITKIFTILIRFFKKLFLKNLKQENILTITEKEFKNIIANSSNIFDTIDKQMIENVFQFEEKEIKDIMVPLKKVLMFEENTKIDSFLKHVGSIKYNRIPIYKQKRTQVTGIIYVKDLIKINWNSNIDLKDPLKTIARKPIFINQNARIDQAFKSMIKQKVHLLIAIDIHNVPMGIVSLEDIIEEIVGEIEDDTN